MSWKFSCLIFGLMFVMSCQDGGRKDKTPERYHLYTPKRAYYDIVRPFKELTYLMCAEKVSTETIDSLFLAMQTKDVMDSLFQVNLYVYNEQEIISRTVNPVRNLESHFIEFAHDNTNDRFDDCVKSWQETYRLYTKGKVPDNNTYYLYRQVAISDFQKAIVEIFVKEG